MTLLVQAKLVCSCQPTFHSTESCVILWKKSPFNRPCSHQSSFYRCLTTRKSLLKKGSLAPLNEVTNQLKQTTHSEKPRVLFSSNSYKNRTLSSPLNAVPTKLNFIRSYETDSPFVQYSSQHCADSIEVPMLLSTKHWHIYDLSYLLLWQFPKYLNLL